MNKVKFREDLKLKFAIERQIFNYELILRSKGLKEATIDRKITNIYQFYSNLMAMRNNKYSINYYNISQILFNYVRDGYFSTDNIENAGTYGYRINIYNTIKEGMNYIYEKLNKDDRNVINDLSDEQKEILTEISKNKFFKCVGIKDNKDSIQVQLIKNLGIKIYFDENEKPYALSHELAELIGKNTSETNRAIKLLMQKIGLCNFAPSPQYVDITMVEDTYINSQNKKQPTYRLHKDLLLLYLLGLTGKEIIEFKMKYIAAFNYIEQEHDRLLKENAELKETFFKTYNTMRLENRDLLLKNDK